MMNLFTLYDSVAQKAGPIFEHATIASAQRVAAGMKFPKGCKANDFELRHVGAVRDDGSLISMSEHDVVHYVTVATYPAEDVPYEQN